MEILVEKIGIINEMQLFSNYMDSTTELSEIQSKSVQQLHMVHVTSNSIFRRSAV